MPASLAAVSVTLLVSALAVGGAAPANAADPVGLGTAEPFAVLAGSTVTNTGPSVITGNLGVSPASAVTGFPPGVVRGETHASDAVARQAKSDLVTAFNNAAGQPTTGDVTGQDLGGMTLIPGVYENSSAMPLTGTVTLDAQGDPDAVFIFKAGSTLVTASDSTVSLVNGASPCNVFWQVGSSATLGTDSEFAGTVMALTSVSVQTATTVEGRILARNGAVTLDTNVITAPDCQAVVSPSPTPGGPSETPTSSPTPGPSDSPTPSPTPGGPTDTPTPIVPSGHPETGLGGSVPDEGDGPVSMLLLFGGLGVGLAALGTAAVSRTRTR